MFNMIKRLYLSGIMSKDKLKQCVSLKGWITEEQYEEISGESY
jgi:uncharacterized XkdX family phage protein